MNKIACYIHVPFCNSICSYCDFLRFVSKKDTIEQWLLTIGEEIKQRCENKSFHTLYIGGGTPSCLSVDQLHRLLSYCDRHISDCVEFTIECNPESLTKEKLECFKVHGVNRLSIGVQTTNNSLLKLTNRNHSKKDVVQCITMAREVGISNISCDAMYSLPTQTIQDVQDTLSFFIECDIPHISIYSLTIEENSVFGKKKIQALDEEIEADMYDMIVSYLTKHGYQHYEISNFAKEGYESIHNSHYWNYDDFIGLSMGSSGKEDHCRYECAKTFNHYFNHQFIEEKIKLSKDDEMFEMVMMSLRLKKGLDKNLFYQKFNCHFDEVFSDEIKKGLTKGWLINEKNHCRCSDEGYILCNSVIQLFLK